MNGLDGLRIFHELAIEETFSYTYVESIFRLMKSEEKLSESALEGYLVYFKEENFHEII